MKNSKGNGVSNKLGISDIEVQGITFGFEDRSKLGVEEGSEIVYSDSYLEVFIDENLEDEGFGTVDGIRNCP